MFVTKSPRNAEFHVRCNQKEFFFSNSIAKTNQTIERYANLNETSSYKQPPIVRQDLNALHQQQSQKIIHANTIKMIHIFEKNSLSLEWLNKLHIIIMNWAR